MTTRNRIHRWIFSAVLPLVTMTSGTLAAQSVDEVEIRRVITSHYLEGRRLADSTVLGQAFVLGTAHMLYVRDDTLADVPIPAYVSRVASARKDPNWKVGAPVKARVTYVDITGNAAVAKVEDRGTDAVVVDYMVLLKIRGQWKIVSKAFDRVVITR